MFFTDSTSMNTDALSYLRGERFHNNYHFKSIRDIRRQSRLDILRSACREKHVIHLGAADHKGLISDKIRAGIWLHGMLTDSATKCIGIDIDNDVVEWVIREHGVSNMIGADIFDSSTVENLREYGHWDFIVLGEILEHIPNPVEFLASIREKYFKFVDEIVITVPNALRLGNFLNAFRNVEAINTDHKYWFTPYTLASVCVASGLTPSWVAPCHYVWELPRRRIIERTLQRRFPLFRDCIVLTAKL